MPVTNQTKSLRLPKSGEILTYELERGGVKNVNLRLRRDGTVHLSVPSGMTARAVEDFLTEREDWIIAARARLAARAAAHPDAGVLADGDSLPYLGGRVSVVYLTVPGKRGDFDFDEAAGVVTFRLPDPSDPAWRVPAVNCFEKCRTAALVADYLKKHTPAVLRRGAKPPTSVSYRRTVSRYGSCTPATGALHFSITLCEYPPAFIEYVVVHELCHLLVPNHSDAFYREVAAILPDWRERAGLAKDGAEM